MRFRCHTGHAFTADSLLSALDDVTEETIWSTIRSVRENSMLMTHLAEHWRTADPRVAEEFLHRANEAQRARRDPQHAFGAAPRCRARSVRGHRSAVKKLLASPPAFLEPSTVHWPNSEPPNSEPGGCALMIDKGLARVIAHESDRANADDRANEDVDGYGVG